MAAFWQAVLPGLGHIYAHHTLRGGLWLIASGIGIVAAIAPLLYVRPGGLGTTSAALVGIGPLLLATADAAWVASRGDEARRQSYGGVRRITLAGCAIAAVMLIFAGAVGVLVFMFWLPVRYVPDDAMAQTLVHGDRVLTDRWALAVRGVAPGDVVVIEQPGDARSVGRVVGLPGDTVEVRRGAVWVNGKAANEPYVHFLSNATATAHATARSVLARDVPPTRVPPGHIFFLRDNRAAGGDSRDLGPISMGALRGQPLLIVWSYVPPPPRNAAPSEPPGVRWERVLQVVD